MIKQLLYKWFGLVDEPCQTCEVLREQLYHSEAERKELLHKLLTKDQPESVVEKEEEPVPIMPQFVPWRVRQQMHEAEDRKAAQLLRAKEKEITELEQELGIAADVSSESGGVKFNAGQK